MRPTPVPDEEVWEGAKRMVIGPPRGDLSSGIAPVEVLVDRDATEGPRMYLRWIIEADDLRRIENGDTVVWMTFWSDHLHPVSLGLPGEDLVPAPECRNCGRDLTSSEAEPSTGVYFHLRPTGDCMTPEPRMVRPDGKPGPHGR